MTYYVHYGTLRTGADISVLPAATCTFGDELRGVGQFQAHVAAGQCRGGALWQATRGAYTFWAVEWADNFGRRIIAGGPVYARAADETGITYGGGNMFSMLAHRKLVDPAWTTAQVPTSAVTFTDLDLGSIIRGIVALVCSSAPGDLPIVYEASRAGTNTRTYNGYDLADASARITEIGNVDAGTGGLGGPDWLFTPRFKGDGTTTVDYTHVEWALTTGTAAAPSLTQATGPVVLDLGAPGQETVGKYAVSEDAGQLATTVYDAGGGTEKARVIGAATDTVLTAAGYPRMDWAGTSNSLDWATVQGYAAGLLVRRKRPPFAVTVSVKAGWWWSQSAGVGTTVRLLDPDSPVLGPVDVMSRVARWSADVTSQWVSLTLVDALAQV